MNVYTILLCAFSLCVLSGAANDSNGPVISALKPSNGLESEMSVISSDVGQPRQKKHVGDILGGVGKMVGDILHGVGDIAHPGDHDHFNIYVPDRQPVYRPRYKPVYKPRYEPDYNDYGHYNYGR